MSHSSFPASGRRPFGYHRGRGGAYRGFSTGPKPSFSLGALSSSLPPDRDIMEGLVKEPLQIIDRPSLETGTKAIELAEFRYIGSYNWTDGDTPTIIVPGSPPEWQDRPMPYNVSPDVGIQYADRNGFYMGKATLLPLVTAVETVVAEHEEYPFDWAKVDFVTDRNGLRRLLGWIDSSSNRKDFRIDIQLAGTKTVLLNRWSKRYREELSGYTFGFNFEKASTKPVPGCTGSATSHHRIVTYDFDGLMMVVRFEVDACIPVGKDTVPKETASVDDLAGSLASVKLSSSESQTLEGTLDPSNKLPLKVIKGGAIVPQSAIVELTTRSEWRMDSFDWKDAFPQLFFSQTAHHFLGVHQKGRFTSVQKRKLSSPELQLHAANIQPDLKKMRQILDVIQKIVIKHGQRGRLSLVCIDGKMQLYERISEDSCLPDETMELFDM